MFKPAAFFIGLRYTRAKRRNHFISFISLASMLGIALGVAVLITVLSVMNGFDREIKNRVFSMVAPVTVSSIGGSIGNWEGLQQDVQQNPAVTSSAPFILGEVLLNNGGSVQPSLITGIIPSEEKNISSIASKMTAGSFDDLKPGKFGIVIGEELANRLNARLGDKITVFTPQVSLSPAGVIPRAKRFTVVGLFRAGGGFGFDMGYGYIQMQDAQRLLGYGNRVTGLHLQIQNVYGASKVADDLMVTMPPDISVSTWADQFGEFFHAVQLEKSMMFLLLMLIIAVAAFNLVATLVMVVNEKQSDIAILRTIGATPRTIMNIFMVQGSLIGIFGTLIGTVGGLILAWNVTAVAHAIETIFHVQLLSANVYLVDYLPSHIEWLDVVEICVASLFLSLIATLYPAWRAAGMDPVESLRYE